MRAATWAGVVLLSACAGVPPIPQLEGRGLIAVDRAVPADSTPCAVPQWRAGDWFRFRRGGETLFTLRVDQTEDTTYRVVEDGAGRMTAFDRDLGRLWEQIPGNERTRVEVAPADTGWTWPLFVDKRWTSHYVRRAPGTALPILAEYHCDAYESITVPAGTFDAYRVWRRARPDTGERFLEKVSVAWYAPDVGWFVRKLEDGVLMELDGFHRQR